MKLYRLACFLLFFTTSFQQRAQGDTALQLSQKQWQELKKGVDYSETYIDPKDGKKHAENTGGPPSSSFHFPGLKYLIYFLVLALVIFLTVRIFGNFKSNEAVKDKTISIESINEIEENMHELNLEQLLKEALLAKNYRIALRLNFLIIIKLLSQKGEIAWAKEKTNWEYYGELRDKLLADQFKEIIMSFETFWYGEHLLTEVQYRLTEPLYQTLQTRLMPHE